MAHTRQWILCGLLAALTCILAPISFPVGPVPVSLALVGVLLSGLLLGGCLGALSQGVYLLLGCIGLPVFSGFVGGLGCLLSPTGGYLLGYLLAAFVAGACYHRFGRFSQCRMKKKAWLVVSMLLGTAACYLLGVLWFILVTGSSLQATLLACVCPFLPGDGLKLLFLTVLTPRLEKVAHLTPEVLS